MSPVTALTAAIFVLIYTVLGVGAIPPLRLDRTGATRVGATLLVAIGAVTPAEAARAIDLGTFALLTLVWGCVWLGPWR